VRDQGSPGAAVLEAELIVPPSRKALGHTRYVLRVAGRVVSHSNRPPVVRIFLRKRIRFEAPVATEANGDGSFEGTWDVYLELPPRRLHRWSLVVEVDDGASVIRHERTIALFPKPLRNDTYIGEVSPRRREFAREHLAGRGVEFGALHLPTEVDHDRCQMSYVDRLTKPQALERFPELEAYEDQIVTPDFLHDLDIDDFLGLQDHRFDFFIAGDVLEHLANPLRFLRSVHDVMPVGSLFLLAVPDRDYTFDAWRWRTSWRHLWRDYRRGVARVSDRHVFGFLFRTKHPLPRRPSHLRANLEVHRQRSVHVHVWDEASFDRFLRRATDRLGLDWEVVDRIAPHDSGGAMVYLLRKTDPVPPRP
jgi:SAM-dependent methyltransferase